MKTLLTLAALLATVAATSHAAGDAAKGATIYNRCKVCHTVEAGKPSGALGPNLRGIVGRPIATVAGFKYSPAFEGQKGKVTWDDKTLDTYLANPKGMIPGTKMAFVGLKNEQERADVIAWLKTQK